MIPNVFQIAILFSNQSINQYILLTLSANIKFHRHLVNWNTMLTILYVLVVINFKDGPNDLEHWLWQCDTVKLSIMTLKIDCDNATLEYH